MADIVSGLVGALDALASCRSEIFNLGTDIEMTTGEVIDIIQAILGKQLTVEEVPERPGDQLRTCADVAKARRVLGYEPVVDAKDGLARAVAWYRERVFGKINVYGESSAHGAAP